MNTKEQKLREEVANEVFHGIPPKDIRENMSPEKLAILLSECEPGTPKFFLVQHELNLRIVKEQNKPKYWAIAATFVVALFAWLLTLLHPSEINTDFRVRF